MQQYTRDQVYEFLNTFLYDQGLRFRDPKDKIFGLLDKMYPPPSSHQGEDQFKVYDLSDLTEEDKQKFATDVMRSANEALMMTFYSLGLKSHLDQRSSNESTGDEFILMFRKIENSQVLGPTVPFPPAPPTPVDQSSQGGLRWVRADLELPRIQDIQNLTTRIDWRETVHVEFTDTTGWKKRCAGLFFKDDDIIYCDLGNNHVVSISEFDRLKWLSDSPAPEQVHPIDFAEWVDIEAVRNGAHKWTIGAGDYTKHYTTDQLLELYKQQNKQG